MGVKIKELLISHPIKIEDLKGKKIVVDGYNTLYQFLSSIRGEGGFYLTDANNNVTSHLAGLFYRNAKLLSYSIWPVYVFDGPPHPLKGATLSARFKKREEAMIEWKNAIANGNMAEAEKKAKGTSIVTRDLVESSKKLLSLLGIPYITAPGDGEALASALVCEGTAWAVASQDYDSILFGSPRTIRNIAVSIRRKGTHFEYEPEIIYSEDTFKKLGIDLDQMIDIAILIGTDFNEGIKGIGPKKGYQLISRYKKIENIPELKDLDAQHIDEVRSIFRNKIDVKYEIKWGHIDREGILKYMCEEHSFSRERIIDAIDIIPSTNQNRLDSFF